MDGRYNVPKPLVRDIAVNLNISAPPAIEGALLVRSSEATRP
jgi:hypothetical protein